MNFGDLWQEHRKFITTVLAGLLVTMIAKLVLNSIYEKKIDFQQSIISRAQNDQKNAIPAGIDVTRIVADRTALEKEYKKLEAAIAHKPLENWSLGPKVADADLHYNTQIDRLRTTTLEAAAIRNIDVDQKLGLPEAFPTSRAEIEHYLRALDVVEQLISIALLSERQFEGGIVRIERIDVEKFNKPTTSVGERKKPFVNRLKVDMTIVGHPRAIDLILRTLALNPTDHPELAGRFLCINEVTVRSLDVAPGAVVREKRGLDPADRRRVEARVSVFSIDVNPEGSLR